MRVHGLAQGKGAPVGRVADLLLSVDQTGDLDRRVDDAGLAEAAHEVDGRRADIDRRGARLHGALCHGLADVAVGAVEVFVFSLSGAIFTGRKLLPFASFICRPDTL